MPDIDVRGDVGGRRSALIRGAAFFAAVGGVLGGLAGTLQWPVVATFFGALEGAATGAVVGVVAGAALAMAARRTRSRWVARGTSAAIAGAAATGVALLYAQPPMVPRAVAIAWGSAAFLLGGAVGPLIAFGMEPARDGRLARGGLRRAVGHYLGWGAAAGAGIGGVTGLVIGIRVYLPTAPVAFVEGAVLGAVSGLVLACVAAGLALLPRVGARR